jgi:hypothetical protein
MPTAAEIKKAIKDAGLEVYRTRGEVVHLAERVRENLLMDAGTFLRSAPVMMGETPKPPAQPGARTCVGFVVRAQRNDFPNDGDEHLFERARQAAATAVTRGYRETAVEVHQIKDPGGGDRTLDTWCEVSFEIEVGDLDAAIAEVRFALAIEKAAVPSRGG